MSLAQRCATNFDSRVRARGADYADNDAVEFDRIRRTGVEASVFGSGIYAVSVDWSDKGAGIVRAGCTCPHFEDGHLCKHIWATLLSIDDAVDFADFGGPQLTVRSVYSNLLDEDDEDDEDEDEFDEGRYDELELDDGNGQDDGDAGILFNGAQVSRSARGVRPPGRSGDWSAPFRELHRHAFREQLPGSGNETTGRTSQVWYVLDVGESVAKSNVTIDLFCRDLKKDGEYGKPKRLRYEEEMQNRFHDPDDRLLLAQLLACSESENDRYGYGYYRPYHVSRSISSCQLPHSMLQLLLPRIAATGRFLWMLDTSQPFEEGHPIAWDDGAPWHFQMRVESDDEARHWRVKGEFRRGDKLIPIDQMVFVHYAGLLLTQTHFVQFDTEVPPAWIDWALTQARESIPFASRDEFLRLMWSAPRLPEIDWPENLALEQITEPPQPCLRVHESGRGYGYKELVADVSFAYGEVEVSPADPRSGFLEMTDGDQPVTRVRRRDLGSEREFLNELVAVPTVKMRAPLDSSGAVTLRQRALSEMVDRLLGTGWRIEAEGKRFRPPGEISIDVQSGIDWFDLDAQIDFGGITAGLPELIGAARRGDKYVELGDGSRGILPEEWLERYGALAKLGDTTDGKMRFQRSQALLLDALLTEQKNTRVDRTFARFREKLRSFDGIAPKSAPRTFQGTLREYQREGLGWFKFLSDLGIGGCLADDMGLGKTIQVLALLEAHRISRLKQGETRLPSLIVVPKSLIFNWMDEAQRFTPRLKMLNYTGTGRRELVDLFDDVHVILTTYGTLRRDIFELKDRRFNFVVLDEAQAIKNASSQAAKASLLLQATRRLALTGTPIENHLGELWSLFEFLNPGMLGHSRAFATLCKNVRNDDGQALSELSRAIAPFVLRRTKEQVLTELPDKTEQTIYCDLTPKERKAYDELRDYYRAKLSKVIDRKGLQQAKIHVLEALLRLRQAACHPGLIDSGKSQHASAKIDTLLEQLEEIIGEGHKALVFSQFTSLLAIVRDRLDRRSVRYEYLDGQTRNRKAIVDRFQQGDGCNVFLISLKAGGQGLNLTEADYVFILDPWWNPAVEMQAIDRAHRIGQTQPVFAYRIIARNTVEEKVLELQDSKRELAKAIITANDSLIRRLTAEDLQRILG